MDWENSVNDNGRASWLIVIRIAMLLCPITLLLAGEQMLVIRFPPWFVALLVVQILAAAAYELTHD
jgi:hypothetical protein